jgi:hypothetical protein
VKNPRHPSFIGQQNVAVNQQVNNQPAPRSAVEGGIRQVELLGSSDGERMDGGTPGKSGGADQSLAPVGEIDGAKDGGG